MILIAVAVDDDLAIRFPVSLLDDRCIAWFALALLDHGCSIAISVAVTLTYGHPSSGRANSNADTDTDFFRACGHSGANACCC
jgi:hypothetical protein